MLSEVRRGGVVVRPARLAVVAAVGVNAEMGPAIRVRRSGGLVAAQSAASVSVDPNREPSARWFVVQNNGIAKGVGEWALTIRLGEPGESGAAVSGYDAPEKLC